MKALFLILSLFSLPLLGAERSDMLIEAHMKAAAEYGDKGDNLSSLSELLSALTLAEAQGDSLTMVKCYNNMGNIYTYYKDYGRSTHFLEMAYRTGRHYLSDGKLFRVVQNLVGNNLYMHRLSEAHRWYKLLEEMKPESDKELYGYCVLLLRGMMLTAEGRAAEAVLTLQQTERYAHEHQMGTYFECGAVEELHKAYRAAGQADSAEAVLWRFYHMAVELGVTHKQIDALRQITATYEQKGSPAMALHYKALRLNLQDSLMDVREFNRISALQTQYETNAKEQRIAEQRHRIVMQRRWIVGILATLVVLVAFITIIVIQKRRVTQAYQHLFALNQELSAHGQPTRDKYATNSLPDHQREALCQKIEQVMAEANNYCAPDFTLTKLAQLTESNTKFVSQAINQDYGVNFNTFLNRYRINEARRRLADTAAYGHLTLQAISESLGFGSVSTFNAAFKKNTGMSPSLYQKMAKKGDEMGQILPNS